MRDWCLLNISTDDAAKLRATNGKEWLSLESKQTECPGDEIIMVELAIEDQHVL